MPLHYDLGTGVKIPFQNFTLPTDRGTGLNTLPKLHITTGVKYPAATNKPLQNHLWSDNADVSYRVRCLRPFMLITRSKRRKKLRGPPGP